LQLVLQPSQLEQVLGDYLVNDWEDMDLQEKMFLNSEDFINNLISDISSKFNIIYEQHEEIQEGFVDMFKGFIGKILNLLAIYLPYEEKLVDTFDFVDLKDSLIIFKTKLKEFCDYFNLLTEEDKPLLQEELIKLKSIKINYYRDNSHSTLHMWDLLKAQENLVLIPKIIHFAETLPTTSAGIEQSFSQIKIFKTDLRNRLNEESLEGLILISQEFVQSGRISIDERMMQLFKQAQKNFYSKKVIKNKSQKLNEKIEQEPLIEEMKNQDQESENKSFGKCDPKMEEIEAEDSLQTQVRDVLTDSEIYPVIKKTKAT